MEQIFVECIYQKDIEEREKKEEDCDNEVLLKNKNNNQQLMIVLNDEINKDTLDLSESCIKTSQKHFNYTIVSVISDTSLNTPLSSSSREFYKDVNYNNENKTFNNSVFDTNNNNNSNCSSKDEIITRSDEDDEIVEDLLSKDEDKKQILPKLIDLRIKNEDMNKHELKQLQEDIEKRKKCEETVDNALKTLFDKHKSILKEYFKLNENDKHLYDVFNEDNDQKWRVFICLPSLYDKHGKKLINIFGNNNNNCSKFE